MEELLGKVFTSVVNIDDEILRFHREDGKTFEVYHAQDCCESVSIEDISGNLEDLVGTPITMAEESLNSTDPSKDKWDESYTWTYYKFATIKGYVTIRWYGESNGYYSESVDFREVK